MPNYRRPWVPGATYFITIVTYRRRRLFIDEPTVHLWRSALARTQQERPFEIHAGVVLPDHVHLMVALHSGDADISSRIGRAKALFTKSLRAAHTGASPPRHNRRREADVWQRRFFDHLIRDEADYAARIEYLHYNPVKHGYARCPKDWAYSSFHQWVERGIYPADWGCPSTGPAPEFVGIDNLAGE